MGVSYEALLQTSGCELPVDEVQARLMDAFRRGYRAWTVDDLLCHPRDAIRFCDRIREATECHDLPNGLILKILVGMREHGERSPIVPGCTAAPDP
jgi:hypothetical protein